MDRKFDAGALLVTGAAVLLVISEFLHWYGLGAGSSVTAWQAFEVLDLVLLGCAFAAVAGSFGLLESRAVGWAAGIAAVVVLTQLVQAPPAGQGADREVGGWIALLATVGMLAGAVLRTAEIAVRFDVKGRTPPTKVATVDKRESAPASSGPPARKDDALFAAAPAASAAPAATPAPVAGATPAAAHEPPVDHFAPLPRASAAGAEALASAGLTGLPDEAPAPNAAEQEDAAEAPTRVESPDPDATQAFAVRPQDGER